MKWRKIGLIYNASGENESLAGSAAVPIAEHLEGDVFRIYFSSISISFETTVSLAIDSRACKNFIRILQTV